MKEENGTASLLEILFLLHKAGHGIFLPESMHPGAFFLLKTINKKMRKEGVPGIKMGDLRRSTDGSMPGLSQMVRNLEKRGLVWRFPDEEDRRVVYVAITEEGQELLRQNAARTEDFLRRLENVYGRENTDRLREMLTAFLTATRQVAEQVREEDNE